MSERWQIRAVLHVNPSGYGFARPLSDAEDRSIFIPPGYLRGALDGDELEVVYWESEKGLEGRIEEIVARKRTRVVGILTRTGDDKWVLEVEDPRLIWPVICPEGPGKGTPGMVVVGQIMEYPHGLQPELLVRVSRTIGIAGALETEVQKILIERQISDVFPDEVEHEAEHVPAEVREHDLERRTDLRGLAFMTIDPPDARDFDDAVCVELLGDEPHNGDYRLWVAVADVAHYLHEGTAIDAEARERCFSTYLPDRAIPMLPHQLSSHMCSLVPKQDRLAMVVSMRVNPAGETSEFAICSAVIHSRRRLTYDEVARELEGAAQAVGELAVEHGLPVVFRVHDKPDEEKLTNLTTAAFTLGSRANPEKLLRPRGVQKFLSQINGKAYAAALNMLMLRAMAQAQYSTDNLGHFALASRAYVHFTSPIRRYPDVISHRVMKAWLKRTGGACGPDPVPRMPKVSESAEQAERSSEREREISGAERETQSLFAAVHMRDRIGDRFEGTVTGLSPFGVFVQIDSPFVDGMVKVADIEKDRGEPYHRDETGIRMVGARSGKTITVGDRVVVEVVGTSVARRQIDFFLIQQLS